MSVVTVGDNIPQWKKDLIARLKHQNKKVAAIVLNGDEHQQQYSNSTVQQPKPKSEPAPVGSSAPRQTVAKRGHVNNNCTGWSSEQRAEIMVQQDHRNHEHLVDMVSNGYVKDHGGDSDSEDLHYGPGIVKKLKNKYLSLALREAVTRPSILQLRKATSLENLLDEDTRQGNNKLFQSKLNGNDTRRTTTQNNRYRHAKGHEIKRARSVETISRSLEDDHPVHHVDVNNRRSLHEEALISEGNPAVDDVENKFTQNVNGDGNVGNVGKSHSEKKLRPKRLQPLMSEKEKPPCNVVRQAKMIFEKRPEQRTRAPPQTGDVAAKVDSFNTIIVKAKGAKKPPVKSGKPTVGDKFFQKVLSEKPPKTLDLTTTKNPIKLDFKELPSPIPDVSRIDKDGGTLCETPDLILTSSPLPKIPTPTPKKTPNSPLLSPKKLTSPLLSPTWVKPASPLTSPSEYKRDLSDSTNNKKNSFEVDSTNNKKNSFEVDSTNNKKNSFEVDSTNNKKNAFEVFNFTNNRRPMNENVSDLKTPTSVELKIDVNGHSDAVPEKNSGKLLLQTRAPCIEDSAKIGAGKKGKIVVESSNTSVFNFTDRKDVPDYISNDTSRSPCRPELPKAGEGGIILIPGATILESFTDEDEEILKSLEGPPSPCDVTFINDNVLIDGKSSLSQKTTKPAKLRISFLDGPEVYEYPSETSLLIDEDNASQPLIQVGHTVPNLGGSSLANYTPKSTEEFHPGVSRTVQPSIDVAPDTIIEQEDHNHPTIEDTAKPFSCGNNADMLF